MPDIVVVGAVESTRIAVEAAYRSEGWTVRAVVTLPPERSARHSDYVDLSPLCREIGAQIIHAPRINDPATLDEIRVTKPDLILVVGWSQICDGEFLSICPGRVLGYHPAPLPRLRGRAAIPWTILLREPISAGTLFWIDEGTDSGPVMGQRFFHVANDETAQSLYDKHMDALAPMISDTLSRIARGETEGAAQDDRYATYAARRTQKDGLIDWRQPVDEIDCLVRAVGRPYPGAFTMRGEDRIVIWQAEPLRDFAHQASTPGQIVAISDTEFSVRTPDGILRVTEWELESGDPLRNHQQLG
ncbi:methionyl-tRNA formyltransferase [Altererythrobacter atlanticus]|uniref:Bifunctional polymyxin resistance protein ArnA n=1 Tax=Croceibacterium atlanticum TaxID=1267766 RepID=A0A0F7KUJ4_9SPHN|nr:formyltransferase family protein [Croceibacterium atlanticum]AKH42856.1 Bifunctional polymyxin resistance protein ArnA [Croceibacterium atlanticum]MBB5731636.1 methionyl-tRNA formyltransferase [Croceibacterium atlanticum]